VAVKIKLMRMGKIRAPYYRIVIADARTKRDGRSIETIGKYHPTQEPSLIEVDSDRAQYWLGVGAQPTEAVAAILKVTGDWQKFKGLPGAEGTLRVADVRADKKAIFEAAAKESTGEAKDGATTPRKRAAKKATEKPASAAPAEASAPAPEAAAPEAAAPQAAAPEAAAPEAAAPEAAAPEAAAPEAAAPDAAAPDAAAETTADTPDDGATETPASKS
jgi:small subunit ribosomal protein S16